MTYTKSGRSRYIVIVRVKNNDESRTFMHDFSSTNSSRYLEKYKQKLLTYGWTDVQFDNLIER